MQGKRECISNVLPLILSFLLVFLRVFLHSRNIHLNFSDPNDFSITFANRYRLNDSSWQYSDLYGDASSMTSSLSFDYGSLKDWESQSNDLIDFANSSLDLSKNALVNNSKNIDITFDETGLIGRKLNTNTGQYYGEQIWLTYNTHAFTDDAFQTVITAIGSVPIPNGGTAYGVNAEILMINGALKFMLFWRAKPQLKNAIL